AAGVDDLAVEHDGAGPAGAAVTDALATGDVEVVPQSVEQRYARLDRRRHLLAIDIELELHRVRPHADAFVSFLVVFVVGEGDRQRRRQGGRRSAGALEKLPA